MEGGRGFISGINVFILIDGPITEDFMVIQCIENC